MVIEASWVVFGAISIYGLLVLATRHYVALAIRKRLFALAKDYERAAERQNSLDLEDFQFSLTGIHLAAAVAPMMASGFSPKIETKSKKPKPDAFQRRVGSLNAFLDRNAWSLPYMAVFTAYMEVLDFFARPFNLGVIGRLPIAIILIRQATKDFESIQIVPAPRYAAVQFEAAQERFHQAERLCRT
jgi:hypothetical protein